MGPTAVDYWRSRVADLKAERRRLMTANASGGKSNAIEDMAAARRRYEDERDQLNAEIDDANDQLDDSNRELLQAEEHLRVAQTLCVPVSDDLSDRNYRALLEQPVVLGPVSEPDEESQPKRDWLTPREVALAWGVSAATVRNWFSGKGRPPFDSSAVQTFSERKRRLLVEKLDRACVAPIVMARIYDLVTRPPLGR